MITIISPVYNGETYIEGYLESLLKLNYVDVQLIIVNDGSTDRTVEILEAYKPRLIKKFREVTYINKDNGGAASCINYALKLVKGKYLMWPDSDDELMPDSINSYLNVFEENPDINMVIGNAIQVDFVTKEKIGVLKIKNTNLLKRNYFKDLILERDVIFAPLTMIKFSAFLESNGGADIYESKGGQNWQMLLPISYSSKIKVLNEPVTYIYNVRGDSHSHSITLEKSFSRMIEHENILFNTIHKLPISEKEKSFYYKLIKNKYISKKLKVTFKLKDRNNFLIEYKKSNLKFKIFYLPIFLLWDVAIKVYEIKKRSVNNG